MKREIKLLRQVLLEAEAAQVAYDGEEHPALWYSAGLLQEGGYVLGEHDGASFRVLGMTPKGHDLVDLLRDEAMLIAVQGDLAAKGVDPDYLEIVLAMIKQRIAERLQGGA